MPRAVGGAARDRGLLIELGRGPARVTVADVPGIDACGLVTGAQSFVPNPEAEALVEPQKHLLVETYGEKGRQILADAQAYADGLNAYWEATGQTQAPATVLELERPWRLAAIRFESSSVVVGAGAAALVALAGGCHRRRRHRSAIRPRDRARC